MSRKTTIYPVFVSMVGCPHQCIFCNQKSITGRSIRNLLYDVKKQIDTVMETATPRPGEKELAFFGGSFTCLPQKTQNDMLRQAYPYIKRGIIDGIRISTRPDYVSDDTLRNLENMGVSTIELGIQSTDSNVLEASERGYTYDEILSSIRNIKKYKFKLGLQMMTGLPLDSRIKSIKTALDFAAIGPDFVRIYPTLVIKNTPLERCFLEGKYNPLTIEEASKWVADLRTIFEYKKIPVIRTGLHSQEGFDSGDDLVAGPYHPAFGEIVESVFYRTWMKDILKKKYEESLGNLEDNIIFFVHPSRLSQAIGQKKNNIRYLNRNYPKYRILVKGDKKISVSEIGFLIENKRLLYERRAYVIQRYEGLLNEMEN